MRSPIVALVMSWRSPPTKQGHHPITFTRTRRSTASATTTTSRSLPAATTSSGSPPGGHLTGALEYFHDDGPWDRPDDCERLNGILGYSRGNAFRGWSIRAMGSDGDWLASDQIPRRAVERGLIDRYGLLDPGPRGSTSRYSLLGREDDDIAYDYASRLPGEPLDGIEDVHFHPVVKPSVRATLVWRF